MTPRGAAPWLVALTAFAFAIARPSADSDMYWHLASGRWMVEHRELLRVDVFSSTVAGEPYSVGEWLGQIVLYTAYAIGGWPGLAILRGLLVAASALFLTRVALRHGGHAAIALPLVVAALVLSSIVWTDRPHLFTLALFPAMLHLLLAARAGRTRLLVAVPPLLLLWTELHGGYALGLATVAIFAAEAVVRRARARAFLLAAVVGGVATLFDPGSLGLGAAIGHAAAPPRFIVEESPPDILRPAGLLFAAFVLGTLAVAMRAGGTLLDALLLLPLLWLALSAQRDMPYFAFAAVPYLARELPRALPPLAHATLRLRGSRAILSGAVVGVGAIVVMSLLATPAAPDEAAYPSRAVERVRGGTGTLLNEYDWGGYLIWRAPERPVFVDGRLFPFLPDVLADWNTAVRLGPGWREVLERHRVVSVLLRPDRPLAGALREDGWRVLLEQPGYVLFERP